MKILAVFGTRPEAIKMCPLVKTLKKEDGLNCKVCLSGQHKEMLQQVMDAFGILADYNLDIMQKEQTLTGITTAILEKLKPVLAEEKPDLVLVHGDTTTSFAAALASFYQQIPVGHVEAGLRTGNKYSPFPEEMNRCLTSRIAELHFAPTVFNQVNLRIEGIHKNVVVTGNTVIDAFKTTVCDSYSFHDADIKAIDFTKQRVILVTAHRRENLGQPLKSICRAILRIADKYEDVLVVYPVHPNPAVKNVVFEYLGKHKNILLTEPLDVLDMHNLLARSFFVMTDSGGLQEEAPACGKPVLVMRTETERPEAVEAGTVRVVGVEEENIYENAVILLENAEEYEQMAKAINPYGDGNACERIADSIKAWGNGVFKS